MLDRVWYISPIGWLELRATDDALASIRKVSQPDVSDLTHPDHPILNETIGQLEEYFLGVRKEFDLPLDFGPAPEFYLQVWEELLTIPYGHTMSYWDMARRLGNIKSVRAVGQAAKANPIAIVVPCHRLIGKGGKLTGYAYGLDTKWELLRLENPNVFGKQMSLFDG